MTADVSESTAVYMTVYSMAFLWQLLQILSQLHLSVTNTHTLS